MKKLILLSVLLIVGCEDFKLNKFNTKTGASETFTLQELIRGKSKEKEKTAPAMKAGLKQERKEEEREKNTSSSSSSNTPCSYSGAESFARKRAGYALSTIQNINSLNMSRVSGMGYNSDYGFLVDGFNEYGGYSFITILISCLNGKYEVDFVEAS